MTALVPALAGALVVAGLIGADRRAAPDAAGGSQRRTSRPRTVR